MKNPFVKNCCDGIYNSLDVHFTSVCPYKCSHCIDTRYSGLGISKPDVPAICKTIIDGADKYNDVLFLGGEPCYYLPELLEAVKTIRKQTNLKIFVTTAVPKNCYGDSDLFVELIRSLDGINFSLQHHDEEIVDEILNAHSGFYRHAFINTLITAYPEFKEKIRINLNIVKPYLYTKKDITECLMYFDKWGINSIKLSEIQHGKDHFVSFEDTFNIKLGSAYFSGCQTYIDMDKLMPEFKTPVLLKRSCFLCEETLKASLLDGLKVCAKFFITPKNNYGVVYGDGSQTEGWI